MEDGLLWFSNKQSTLQKYTFKYGINNLLDMNLNIPLQYVCFSSTRILTPKDKSLTITKNSLRFECYNNADVRTHSTAYQIDLKQILKFSYAPENCLFGITMQQDFYDRMVASTGTDDKLFRHRIWFCLDVETIAEYRILLDQLSNNPKTNWKPSPIDKPTYDAFVSCLTHNDVLASFVSKWKAPEVSSSTDTAKSPRRLRTSSEETAKSPRRVLSPSAETGNISKRLRSTHKAEFPIEDCITSPMLPPRGCHKRSKSPKADPQKSVYVPSPNHSIEICTADIRCLRPGNYLNDNVINLYVTYIFYEIMTPAQRQRTHFFNCFFNTKLIGTRAQAATDTPESRHARVAKWTKNVDIFEKDFLIVPVIECQHWFLVIVCFPWMAGMVDYGRIFHPDGEDKAPPSASIPANDTEFATRHRVDRLQALKATEGPDYLALPCILIFDSLTVAKRTDKVLIIRDYLKTEWDTKRAARDGPLVFDKNTARGYSPKVPQQNNHTDCGVYLLHYVESFFKCPIKNFSYTFFKTFLTKWFEQSQVERKRAEISDTIMKVIQKSDDVDMINK